MLRMDHRYNNPLFLCFGDIMLHELNVARIRRAVRHARRVYVRRQGEQQALALQAAAAAKGEVADETELKKIGRQTCMKLLGHYLMEMSYDEQHRRAVLARNRWQLAWRLMQQPDFQLSRRDAQMRKALAKAAKERALMKARSLAAFIREADTAGEDGAEKEKGLKATAASPRLSSPRSAPANDSGISEPADAAAATSTSTPLNAAAATASAVPSDDSLLQSRFTSVLGHEGGAELLLQRMITTGGKQALRNALDSLRQDGLDIDQNARVALCAYNA